ncbi:MAG: hydroxymethylglutaryl-CoA lyase [Casimicrobiaceae bacterium]
MSNRIFIHDVVARDGLQIEPAFVPTERKIELIDLLSSSGMAKIEATSFVSPKAVPNLRDAAEVMAGIRRNPAVTYVALVPNARGAERALAAAVDEIVLVVSVSETHNRANVRRSVAESFAGFGEVFDVVRGSKLSVVGALATSFGCPFEGVIPEQQVLDAVARYVDLGVSGVTLADTTGMANPRQVEALVGKVRARWPDLELALHFHNTRGMGLANVLAGLAAGVARYEGCLGGLGGCPFAPGATGNICTEDLVHMLQAMGYDTGVDLDALLAASRRLGEIVAHELPGQVVKSGKSTDLHRPPPTVAPQEQAWLAGAEPR